MSGNKKDCILFSFTLRVEELTERNITEKQRSRIFWTAYGISFIGLLIFVAIFSASLGILISVPILLPSIVSVILLQGYLLISGRKGFIYCEEELEYDVLVIESGVNKPRYYFKKTT